MPAAFGVNNIETPDVHQLRRNPKSFQSVVIVVLT
jgi:hypothetical protein